MIDLENVSKKYDSKEPALKNVTLHIDAGEFVFIVGASGSGKSTLIKLLLREIKPTSGKITINGKAVGKIRKSKLPLLRRDIGIVFQDFRLFEDRNVYENVAFAQKAIEAPSRGIRKKVLEVLSVVGLLGKYKKNPKELSGGEQQRVAIARALINKPAILLADEPTGNLDAANTWEIMRVLENANESGTTVIVVTHNMDIVRAMHKRVVSIEDGRIVYDTKEGGDFDEI